MFTYKRVGSMRYVELRGKERRATKHVTGPRDVENPKTVGT
jgi:hypothetical protein